MLFKAAAPLISREEDPLSFELIGFDFMVDSDLEVFLIEVNKNPCLSTLSSPQQDLIGTLVNDVIGVAIDPLFKLQTKSAPKKANNFELVDVHFF